MAKDKFEPSSELSPCSELQSYGKRIGLLGGTFDPVHHGHLAVACAVQKNLCLDSVVFVPSFLPPHKNHSFVTSFTERAAMLEIALEGRPTFFLSRIEAERKGPSFTSDTLSFFRRQLLEEAELFFITGGDAFFEIHTWKSFGSLLHSSHLVVVDRSVVDGNKLSDYIKRVFPDLIDDQHQKRWGAQNYRGMIYLLTMDPVPVSSSMIREHVTKEKSIAHMVPGAVQDYIKRHQLYAALS